MNHSIMLLARALVCCPLRRQLGLLPADSAPEPPGLLTQPHEVSLLSEMGSWRYE